MCILCNDRGYRTIQEQQAAEELHRAWFDEILEQDRQRTLKSKRLHIIPEHLRAPVGKIGKPIVEKAKTDLDTFYQRIDKGSYSLINPGSRPPWYNRKV